jgi:hypothetical protein
MDISRHVGARRLRARGVTLIWMAIAILVLISFTALAVDFGYTYYTTQQLQNAADAAALAGAQRVWFSHDEARQLAMGMSSENDSGGTMVLLDENASNDANGDIVVGLYDEGTRLFTPNDDINVANAVLVNARRTSDSPSGPLNLVWGSLFGRDFAQFNRWAIAVNKSGPTTNGIIALDDDDPASVHMHGTPYLDVSAGSIQVNSSSASATRMSGTPGYPSLGQTNVNNVGEVRFDGYVPAPNVHFNEHRDFVDDPLASLPEPDEKAMPKFNKIGASGTYNPGYYPGGFDDKPGTTITLNPGVYVFDNGVRMQGTVTGYNVMIFIRTGAFDQESAKTVTLTPPSSGVYEGIQVFQSRTNTTGGKLVGNGTVTGVSASEGTGTFYFPAAKFELGGTNSQYHIDSIIAKNVEIYGTGEIHVLHGYESSARGQEVYLAE